MSDLAKPVTATDAKMLFAPLRDVSAMVVAVSGGPDSVALLWLLARWRRVLKHGPALLAVTIDHSLRSKSAREARDVKRLAASLGVPHRTLRWTGAKPKTGLPAAARTARYALLAKAAAQHGATHILTAHTQDDQAETLLMRIARGSGMAGLSAMARQSRRDGLILARPLLDVSKAQLVATLTRAKIPFVIDPTNLDPHFTRPRLRALMAQLATEGFHARNLARLASRLSRANAALDGLTDEAERSLLATHKGVSRLAVDARAFAALPEEIRLRLLLRMIDRVGHEGPAELGKAETLLTALDRAGQEGMRLKQTLAGALISWDGDLLIVEAAPPRRLRRT